MTDMTPAHPLNVLIIGSGAREHAAAWACSRHGHQVFCTPGNPGIAQVAKCINHPQDNAALTQLAQQLAADVVIIGPEAYLASGLADAMREAGLAVFGPSKGAAQIETNKAWSKAFMQRWKVPTAAHQSFETLEAALRHVTGASFPLVVKDAGLRGGKGVTIAHELAEAEQALKDIFSQPGAAAVTEEFMQGQEVSVLAFCGGEHFALALPAQDHKTIYEGDKGPMTGGMGVICPFPMSEQDLETVRNDIIGRTLTGLREEGLSFCGVLYAGLMLTETGPKVVEFNARFGDPEAEAVLPLLESDLAQHALAAAQGRLDPSDVHWSAGASAVIILAAQGYPGTPERGVALHLPDPASGEHLFHAGTALNETGELVSSGGRVLAAVATAPTLPEALAQAYALAEASSFDGAQLRRDIGARIGLGDWTKG